MNELFPLLEPPPGGLARLRQRLAEGRQRRRWVVALAAAVPLAAGAAAALLLTRPPSAETLGLALPDLRPPVEPVAAVAGDASPPVLQRLASADPKVVIYLVAPTGDLDRR
ncbi:MAG: hypothetical protein ACYDCL_15925 [Myxococcales bacterium]